MIALEPGETGKIILSCHEGNEKPPYCLVVALSIRKQREYVKKFDAMFEQDSGEGTLTKMVELFNEYVVEFIGYGSQEVEDAFTQPSIMEVLRKMCSGSILTTGEKKS